MKDNLIYGSIGTALSAIGTGLQTNEVLETISLIITIIGGIITFIIAPLLSWYNKSKTDDSKIDDNELQEAIKIISHGSENIKEQINKNEKGKKSL